MMHYGHKNVPDIVLEKTLRLFNGGRVVHFFEFNEAMKEFGINISPDQLKELETR